MYLEVIAELHYNKHDDVIHAYVSEACVSSSQSKCICAIKRFLVSSTAMYVSSSSFMYWRIPCYCDACLNSSALRVGVKTLLNKKYNDLYADQSWSVPQPAKKFGGGRSHFWQLLWRHRCAVNHDDMRPFCYDQHCCSRYFCKITRQNHSPDLKKSLELKFLR